MKHFHAADLEELSATSIRLSRRMILQGSYSNAGPITIQMLGQLQENIAGAEQATDLVDQTGATWDVRQAEVELEE